jgi:NTP pyrophosphatase (non-canonical NTP hydrolase)
MKLSEYQSAALSTAMEKAFSLDYLVPMIIGELGELSGQKAKAHWHGWPAEKLEVELVSEYGDVCWGTAILLHMAEVSDLTSGRFPTATFSAGSALQTLLQRAAYMHE